MPKLPRLPKMTRRLGEQQAKTVAAEEESQVSPDRCG
jgi:hypothetical protein